MDQIQNSIQTLIVTYGTRIVGVFILLMAAWIISSWSKRLVVRALERAQFDLTLTRFFGNLSKWAILVMGVLAALGVFGVETTSFAAVIAAGGLAVGLAFQGTLSNFAAGVMLLVFRPFKVGDVVTVAGVLGIVQEIDLFTIKVDTPDNRRIILPNSSVFGATIENITHHERRRADVPVGVDYGADIDKTRKVLEQASAAVPGALSDPAPQVVLNGLGASSVDWEVRVWAPVSDFLAVKQATVRAVKMALDQAGISIPFPQMDVHLGSVPESATKH